MRNPVPRSRFLLFALGGAIVATLPGAGFEAQQRWSWPEQPKNLKVLSKDLTGEKLRPVMIGFTSALGVRCTHCHVGEEGKPLTTYDFVSDANPNKERAREMLRMLGSINDHLKKIQPSGEKRVNMGCHTCHQGRARPVTLQEDLGEVHARSGIAAAIARYHELRARHHGRGGYDFGERSLNTFGYEFLDRGDQKGAIAIFELNAEQFPSSANVWDSLADAWQRSGNAELAKSYYRKSLEIDPENRNALAKLRELEQKPAPPEK